MMYANCIVSNKNFFCLIVFCTEKFYGIYCWQVLTSIMKKVREIHSVRIIQQSTIIFDKFHGLIHFQKLTNPRRIWFSSYDSRANSMQTLLSDKRLMLKEWVKTFNYFNICVKIYPPELDRAYILQTSATKAYRFAA